mmetsp:Transcript_5115/g.11173  ORF Transcript_5115/g.11173 Transcript_5115/m.11173 type:complete len:270 (+) Transcript_5115:321-1130(+)
MIGVVDGFEKRFNDIPTIRLEIRIGNFKTNFGFFERFFERFEHLPNRRFVCDATTHSLDDDLHREIRAIIQVIVFTHRSVSARFNHERRDDARRVEFFALVNDVFVPAHETQMVTTLRLDKLVQTIRCDAVGNNRRSRVFFEHNFRKQCDEFVAIDFFPARVDDRASIDVSVKHYAEISLGAEHCAHASLHRLFIFWVRAVVREAPIGIEKLRAVRIRAERRENQIRKKSAAPVTSVHDDFHPRQWLIVVCRRIHAFANDIAQLCGVGG